MFSAQLSKVPTVLLIPLNPPPTIPPPSLLHQKPTPTSLQQKNPLLEPRLPHLELLRRAQKIDCHFPTPRRFLDNSKWNSHFFQIAIEYLAEHRQDRAAGRRDEGGHRERGGYQEILDRLQDE